MLHEKRRVFLVLPLIWCLAGPSSVRAAAKIRFWPITDSQTADLYRDISKEFTAKTGVEVEVQPMTWGGFVTKFVSALAAEMPPDLVTCNYEQSANFGTLGKVLAINKTFPEDTKAILQQIYGAYTRGLTYKDEVYGLPAFINPVLLYCRKSTFARLGLSVPRTWDEYDQVCAKLNAAGYRVGWGANWNTIWGVPNYIFPLDAPFFSADGGRVAWREPAFVRGFKYAVRVWNRWDTDLSWENAVDFIQEDQKHQLPMMTLLSDAYLDITLRAKDPQAMLDDTLIAPVPAPPGRQGHQVIFGTNFLIFKDSAHPREALEWIKHFYRLDIQMRLYRSAAFERGDLANLYLSPLKEFYKQDLTRPAGSDSRVLGIRPDHLAVMEKTIQLSDGLWCVMGGDRAAREMNTTLERITDKSRDYVSARAKSLDLSSREFKQALGAGKFAPEAAAYEQFLDKTVDEELPGMAERGDATLDDFQKHYVANYGGTRGQAPNILKIAKILAGSLLALGLAWILLSPRRRRQGYSYLFISPSLILIGVFFLIPLFISLYLSLTHYSPLQPLSSARWAGLDNFREILSDPIFYKSLGHSLLYALVTVPVVLACGFLFAWLLDQKPRLDAFFKFIFFSPMVTSVIAVTVIFSFILGEKDYGLMNFFLLSLHIIRDPVQYINDPGWAMPSVMLLGIWGGIGFSALIFLGGLQNIPKELYESAEMDGAGILDRIRHVSLPGVRGQTTFLALVSTIGAIQVFETVWVLYGSSSTFGPDDAVITLMTYLFRIGFSDFFMGKATAMAYLIFALVGGLTLLNWLIFFRPRKSRS